MSRTLPEPVAAARSFAVEAHGDQKYGSYPYVHHLDAVDDLLCVAGYGDQHKLRQVGFLHDVIEDTEATTDSLRAAGFPADVVDAVAFCSDEEGPNRKTRKRLTYHRMSGQREKLEASPYDSAHVFIRLGIIAKVVDRLTNIAASQDPNKHDLLDMYWKEREDFRAALFSPGLCDALWVEYDKLLAQRPPKPRRRGR